MKEPEQDFSPESIEHLTERAFGHLPTQESRLVADLYQTYTPSAVEQSRSLERIWSRFFAQVQEQHMSLQEGPSAPVLGSFQQSPQPLPRRSHRSRWSRLSSGMAVAVVLLIILSWVLFTYAFPMGSPPTTLGASLKLGGGPQLNQEIVFLVKSSEGGQYLAAHSFDIYDGHSWRNSALSGSQVPAQKRMVSEGSPVHLVTQRITVVNPPGEPQPYIFGAGQIASVDEPTTLLIDTKTGGLIAVLANHGQALSKGDQYTVQSYVSSADRATLSSVSLPADAPKLPPNFHGPLPPTYYNPAILSVYLQLPKIDSRVKALALQLTAGAHTMYDKVIALEIYLRTNYHYTTDITLPSGAEGVSWFLFSSGNRGFCNYFATAMAVMARELGIPARVVVGDTAGTYDAKTQTEVVRGSDAHAWTQIYFAGYGWINFEPSASFPSFVRPLRLTA